MLRYGSNKFVYMAVDILDKDKHSHIPIYIIRKQNLCKIDR